MLTCCDEDMGCAILCTVTCPPDPHPLWSSIGCDVDMVEDEAALNWPEDFASSAVSCPSEPACFRLRLLLSCIDRVLSEGYERCSPPPPELPPPNRLLASVRWVQSDPPCCLFGAWLLKYAELAAWTASPLPAIGSRFRPRPSREGRPSGTLSS